MYDQNHKKSSINVKIVSINVDVVRLNFTINTEIQVNDLPNSMITASFQVDRNEKEKMPFIASCVTSRPRNIPAEDVKQIVNTIESAMHSYLARKKSFIIDTASDEKTRFDFELIKTPTSIYSIFNMHFAN